MLGLLIRWLVSAGALWLTSHVVSGVRVDDVGALLLAAAVIGWLNALVRPVLLLLTLPLTVLTLGLFVLVLNASMLWLAASFVPGFHVSGIWAAFWGWLLLSFFTFVINLVIGKTGVEVIRVRRVIRG